FFFIPRSDNHRVKMKEKMPTGFIGIGERFSIFRAGKFSRNGYSFFSKMLSDRDDNCLARFNISKRLIIWNNVVINARHSLDKNWLICIITSHLIPKMHSLTTKKERVFMVGKHRVRQKKNYPAITH